MAHEYKFVEDDTGSKLRITCKRTSGAVIDLTGSTVELIWKAKAGTLITQPMDIVAPATDGVAEYQFDAGELEPERMHFTARITDVSSRVLTSNGYIDVPVRRRMTAEV